MSAAFHCAGEALLLERAERAGGLAVTNFDKGYGFDVTGHWLHMRDERVRKRFSQLVSMREVERRSRIFAHGRGIAYPFQSNLKDLPPDVRVDCLVGAVEAHVRRKMGVSEPGRFDGYVLHHFGEGIAREFMFPYNRKLWGVVPGEISHAWCQRFVPVPDLKQILEGALTDSNEGAGYNASFSYPLEGGIGALTTAMAAQLPSIVFGQQVRLIHAGERWLETSDGTRYGFKNLISTVPLKELVLLTEDAPRETRQAASLLRCTSLTYYDLGLNRKVLDGLHWVYLPHPELPAYRIGSYSNAVATMAPDSCTSLYVELANGMDIDHGESLLSVVLDVISRLGTAVERENVDVWTRRKIDYAYVIYDENYEAATQAIFDFLGESRVHSIGRYGKWVYASMEDALIDGRAVAREIA